MEFPMQYALMIFDSFVLLIPVRHPVQRGRRAFPPETRKGTSVHWGDCERVWISKCKQIAGSPVRLFIFSIESIITNYHALCSYYSITPAIVVSHKRQVL